MAALKGLAPLILTAALVQMPLALSLLRGWSASQRLSFDAASAPRELAHFQAVEDERLEPDVVDMLRPDSYLMRLYRSESAQDAWLYLASYSATTDSTGAHDPAVCYPAQGWDLQEMHTLTVALESGESLTAKVLLANQAGQQELVLYWFQPVGRWPQRAPWEQLLRAYDGFTGRPQYVFVRLSTQWNDLAQGTLLELARKLAPWLRDAMLDAPLDATASSE